jgi:signal-transduction protein with cAMP-binding, CBS, and nucleotidyltransferase domain
VIELESVDLFRDLKRDEQKVLHSMTQARQFAAGREIFRQGDPGDGMYFVKSGQVEISGVVGANTRHVFPNSARGKFSVKWLWSNIVHARPPQFFISHCRWQNDR